MTKGCIIPDLIITTPTQLLAAYVKMLESIGMRQPEVNEVAALNTEMLLDNLRELNEGK